MHALLAIGDHRVSRLQAIENFHLARAAQTHLYFHTLSGAGFVTRSGQQLDDEHFGPLGDDGFFGNHHGRLAHAKHSVDPGKHAGAQLQLAVINAATHTHRAAIGVNQRVNRLNPGAVLAARQGVNVQAGRLACFDFGLETFRQTEVNKNGVQIFDVDDVGAVLQIIAHVH